MYIILYFAKNFYPLKLEIVVFYEVYLPQINATHDPCAAWAYNPCPARPILYQEFLTNLNAPEIDELACDKCLVR